MARGPRFSPRILRAVAIACLLLPTVAWTYGADSNSPGPQPGFPPGSVFYSGKLTEGNQNCTGFTAFNTSGANAAGANDTYGYTLIYGPGGRRGNDAYSWGVSQAQNLYNCWLTGPYRSYLYGLTLFADLETIGGGWQFPIHNDHSTNSIWQANVNVVSGFVNEAYQLTLGLVGGVYAGSTFTGPYFDYWGWGNRWFPIWNAGGCSGVATTQWYPPSNAPGYFWENQFVNLHNANTVGNCQILGQWSMAWQYVVARQRSGGYDYDLTPFMHNYGCFNYCGDYFTPTY